jgi:uncharacterized protein
LTDGNARTVLIRRSDRRRIPWKNGAGATELIATGDGDSPAWRVSVADIGPGRTTFSSFHGVNRIFTVIGDQRVALEWDRRTVDLEPLEPFEFDGELGPDCVAAGPTNAFNVMVEAATTAAHVVPHHLTRSRVLTDPVADTVIYVHRGSLASGDHVAMAGDCLVVARKSVEASGTATILVAAMTPLAADQRV